MKVRRKLAVLLTFAAALLMVLSIPVSGAAKTYKSQWTHSNGNYYYWNSKGVKFKGFHKLGSKYYFFDSQGIQRTGWRYTQGNYRFFTQANGKKGYMVKNTTINGIKIDKNGNAVINARSLRKLKIMVKCSKLVDSMTNADQSKEQKMKILFEYTKSHFRPVNLTDFRRDGDWDMYYAEYMLNHGWGDCYCYGAVFAYIANAIGYQNSIAVSSGGHGWAEINGLVYDPNWARVIGTAKCFAVPMYLSGRDSRPNWAKYGCFKKPLNVL